MGKLLLEISLEDQFKGNQLDINLEKLVERKTN